MKSLLNSYNEFIRYGKYPGTRYPLPTISYQPYIKGITLSWWKWYVQYSPSKYN